MAHKEIDRIKYATNMVSYFMKDAESVLLQGSDFDVKKTLPVVLEHIKDISMTCKE